MLRKLRSRLTYANVMSTIACFGVLATGSAYAANTVFSTDIVDGQVNSADVKDQSLTTFDVSTFLGADIVDGTLTSDDIGDGTLNDEDVASAFKVAYPIDIGQVPATTCINRAVNPPMHVEGDHLVITPSLDDANGALTYEARYETGGGAAFIHVCNWSNATVDDGTTHFNVLAIDAQ